MAPKRGQRRDTIEEIHLAERSEVTKCLREISSSPLKKLDLPPSKYTSHGLPNRNASAQRTPEGDDDHKMLRLIRIIPAILFWLHRCLQLTVQPVVATCTTYHSKNLELLEMTLLDTGSATSSCGRGE